MKLIALFLSLFLLVSCGVNAPDPNDDQATDDPSAADTASPTSPHSPSPAPVPTVPPPVPRSGQRPEPPTVHAGFALVAESKSGEILFSKRAHDRAYPASLTKIMTVLLAIEAVERGDLSLDDTVTVSASALHNLSEYGSSAGLMVGEELSFRDLLYCAMLISANEACNVLAEQVAGNVTDFVAMMNAKAAELGCEGTNFVNTHGLHDEKHYTTAYDIYLITMEARKLPVFLQIAGTASHTVPATNKSAARGLTTTNHLISALRNPIYFYPDATGGKTGFTTPAGNCLVSSAEKNGLETICVVLSAVRLEDGRAAVYVDSITLHDWVFENYIRPSTS